MPANPSVDAATSSPSFTTCSHCPHVATDTFARWPDQRTAVILIGLTGAVLSINPALERLATSVPAGVSVAELAGRCAPPSGAEQIQRTASGTIIVYYSAGRRSGVDRVDPSSGKAIAPYAPPAYARWFKEFHRSLLLDTPGSAAVGIAALLMLLVSVSGLLLLVKRVGGWRQLARPLHGNRSQRWHAAVARFAVAGLLLSAVTGSYMSAATFTLIADGSQDEPDIPANNWRLAAARWARLPALLATRLVDLRELSFPLAGDSSAVYTLRTRQGDAYVDQSSGALLAFRAHSNVREAFELIYQLHTGEGLWWLGLALGLSSALGAPWLAVTGIAVWWQRQRAKPRIANNSAPASADTVILVGSENNSSWGFARALHDALRQAGQRVHTAPMNQFSSRHNAARQLFILTATYGDGDAPASATHFLTNLAGIAPNQAASYAVLGFGDPPVPHVLPVCTGGRRGDGGARMAPLAGTGPDRPPVAAGIRALGEPGRRAAGPRARTRLCAGTSAHACAAVTRAHRLRRGGARSHCRAALHCRPAARQRRLAEKQACLPSTAPLRGRRPGRRHGARQFHAALFIRWRADRVTAYIFFTIIC